MPKPLSVHQRKHFLSGRAARHQVQGYKIISCFQALLLSHFGRLFFAKTNRVEVGNKLSLFQSEDEFLNAENHFGDLKRICHKAEQPFLEPSFFSSAEQIPLWSRHVSREHKCKSTCPVFRATGQAVCIPRALPLLL